MPTKVSKMDEAIGSDVDTIVDAPLSITTGITKLSLSALSGYCNMPKEASMTDEVAAMGYECCHCLLPLESLSLY
jgi:hypothetical protein